MFVSSYSTYIQTNTSDKTAKQKVEKSSSEPKSFNFKANQSTSSGIAKSSTIPVNYISKSQVLNNKQELDYQKNQLQESQHKNIKQTKQNVNNFKVNNSLVNAKSAYESNSKMFSLIMKPQSALDQTPKISKALPPKAQEAKELSLKHLMVNTYLDNDNYYKVTA